MDPAVASRIVMSSADVAVVIDAAGVVADVSLATEARLPAEFGSWLGKPWIETVALDSRAKAQALLKDAAGDVPARAREINHLAAAGGATVPIRYTAVKLSADGRVLAIGRDLRAIAALQQQLVQFQQSMEREYARIRAADTRYRVLFQVTPEAVMIVDAGSRRVVEVNPAAVTMLGVSQSRLVGRMLTAAFADRGGDDLARLLALAANGQAAESVILRLSDNAETRVKVSAALFRQEGGAYYLVHMSLDDGTDPTLKVSGSFTDDVIERLPEAFVVTDGTGAIQHFNHAFVELAGIARPETLRGSGLDQWLGHSSVDFGVIVASLRDTGTVRNVGTVLRGAYGAIDTVDVSGSSAGNASHRRYGFLIRPSTRLQPDRLGNGALARSPEQMRELVGRVPLKELVRETTEIIEKLCIEAALDMAGDNRASAAEMLGLSRQSLYAKLHRFGLGDLSGPDDD